MLGSKHNYTMALQTPGKAGYVFLRFNSYNDFKHYYLHSPTLIPRDESHITCAIVQGEGLPPGIHNYSDFEAVEERPSSYGTDCAKSTSIMFGYEVIEGYQCPYWDFDGELTEEDFNMLTQTIEKTFSGCRICVNLYNSNGKKVTGEEKYSYHVVVKGVFVRSHKECGELTAKIVAETNSSRLKAVYDASVYTSKRNLRLLGSRKLNDRRVKVFDRTLFVSDGYKSSHADDPLSMSLVSRTEDSLLYEISEAVKPTPIVFDDVERVDCGIRQEHYAQIQELLEQEYPNVFTPDRLVNGLLSMKRKTSARCKLCDKVHDSIGCFITRIRGEFFFNCYRKPKDRYSLSNTNGDDEVELFVVDETQKIADRIEQTPESSSRVIKTKRGDITVEAYIAKLVRMYGWSQ